MKSWIATIKNKGLHFAPTTRNIFIDYLSEHEGDMLEITAKKIKKTVSKELRGFYFGSWLPFIKNLDEHLKQYSIDDLHDFLSDEFHGQNIYNPISKKESRISKSIMSNTVKTTEAFLYMEKIRLWVAENYAQELPDAQEFKSKRDMHFQDKTETIEYPVEEYNPKF